MKTVVKKSPIYFYIFVSVVLVFYAIFFSIQTGYQFDEIGTRAMPKLIENWSWILLAFSIFNFLVSSCIFGYSVSEIKNNRFFSNLLSIIMLVTIFFMVRFSLSIDYKKYEVSFLEDESQLLSRITLSQLEKKVNNEDESIIYIGRDTCEVCQNYLPVLLSELKDKRKKIDYYNTDLDRQFNKENMDKILNEIDIKEVPTIIYVKNGNVLKKSVGDSIYKDTKYFIERIK
ncbi:hypothetical protein CKN82_02915 [Carnobacterium divergens]|uniref:thioredoxin family protein n=1 Tax=Carnobacterium divergens TaxID=2748 RepID=UPI000EF2E70B|nr:thioredoxin family protein [Carnobacterium divergens]ANZ99100.1 hypothetical protein BFC22_02805 [Carnobacterium divergens]MDT1997172.1 thioredoxin family protein [Carnobacterium divergens]MDT2011938.1 thioredoxin family protein [Carnobacterium divergens]TFI67614.1 hypothetical protein CKN59_03760 [Carnobacterium divergens]TFI67735.1 hypothetical protein CKN76_03835 [Carnobacterium divergens]